MCSIRKGVAATRRIKSISVAENLLEGAELGSQIPGQLARLHTPPPQPRETTTNTNISLNLLCLPFEKLDGFNLGMIEERGNTGVLADLSVFQSTHALPGCFTL